MNDTQNDRTVVAFTTIAATTVLETRLHGVCQDVVCTVDGK